MLADAAFDALNKGCADGFGEAATQNDEGEREDRDVVGDGDAQQVCRGVDDFDGEGVFFLIGAAEGFGADLFHFAIGQPRERGFVIGLDQCGQSVHHVGAGTEILDGSLAQWRAGKENGVTDLAGGLESTIKEFAIEDEAATDAGASPDTQDILRTFGSAEALLTQDRDVDIVIEENRCAQAGRENAGEFVVGPIQIDGFENDSGIRIDGAGGTDADGGDLRGGDAGLVAGLLNAAGETIDNSGGALFSAGFFAGSAEEFVVGIDDTDLHVGAAEINADKEGLAATGGRARRAAGCGGAFGEGHHAFQRAW